MAVIPHEQIIRAFKGEDGITRVYNYSGHPSSGQPIYPLKRIWISSTVVRLVDDKKLYHKLEKERLAKMKKKQL